MTETGPSTEQKRRPSQHTRRLLWLVGIASLAHTGWLQPQLLAAADDLEFFEKRVRPVLAEQCARCHSAQAEKIKGELVLDSQVGLMKGGESGPVVVPGHPEQSRLITAIGYADPNLQMPPKARLTETQIADLTEWVRRGAPWPDTKAEALPANRPGLFDLAERRRRHWAWQPLQCPPVPAVREELWCRTPVDRFLLARLEREGLGHAPPADWRVLLRRLHFDLTGLPPTRMDVARFEENPSREAFEAEVHRLLASPRFGERWARHWLDLVRYAETLGHEFDYANPNAWRYRDYIIRAFNSDVPYNQLVVEHIAGDLLDSPRRNPADGRNESVIGTAFYWLGQRDHSPVDVRLHQAELIDNQIDVLSKTFLGLTVACARCHDHKFDAIPTRDYYSLYGILSSSRYAQSSLDPPEPTSSILRELKTRKAELRQAIAAAWSTQTIDLPRYLAAAAEAVGAGHAASPEDIADLARENDLNPLQLARWIAAEQDAELSPRPGVMGAWIEWNRLATPGPAQPSHVWQTALESSSGSSHTPTSHERPFADFEQGAMPTGWFAQEFAFADQPASVGDFVVGTTNQPVTRLLDRSTVNSGLVSGRFQGVLSSPSFTITNRFIHVLAAGRNTRVNVRVDNFTMIRDPIYGGLKRGLDHDASRWLTIDVSMWQGHKAYLEFNDTSAPDPGDDVGPDGIAAAGWLSVRQVAFSDRATPPASGTRAELARVLGSETPCTTETLAERYAAAAARAVANWKTGSVNADDAALLEWLVQWQLLDASAEPAVLALVRGYNQIEATIPIPVRTPSLVEGTGADEHVFVRGNHRLPGEPAPRRFLCAIAGEDQPPIAEGTGRRELAERLAAPGNPFTARVMVNRVWSHLFGRGLVATPDDFGELGRAPSHPELLDWLANWYRTDGGWSTKRLIRLLVTSSAYAMSSKPEDARGEEADPTNTLLRRMPVRRLEGEAIRDAILAASGGLNLTMFGPPVPTYLTEFMDGRGRPARSGPLDGEGRRTVYLEVRRNFVSPMMRAFDMPVPFTTVGQRTVSSVPAQALILMNDPFVAAEAGRWADRLLKTTSSSTQERLRDMYEAAFARRPTEEEEAAAARFLREQTERYEAQRVEGSEARAWVDLCHVLFNVKEFVFLN